MRSGEIAQLAGVTTRTLRHYRSIGLLREPTRKENGYCDYTPDDLVRILRIKNLAALGLSLDAIKQLIDESATLREGETAQDVANRQLDELDRELSERIAELEEQRRTIARLRENDLDPDLPPRVGELLRKLIDTRAPRATDEADRASLLLAAHLYGESELEELERFVNALVDRDLIDEYRSASDLLDSLPPQACEQDMVRAETAMVALLEKTLDCFDLANWDVAPSKAEELIDSYASGALNPAQNAVSDRIMATIYERIKERAHRNDLADSALLDLDVTS